MPQIKLREDKKLRNILLNLLMNGERTAKQRTSIHAIYADDGCYGIPIRLYVVVDALTWRHKNGDRTNDRSEEKVLGSLAVFAYKFLQAF